MGWSAVCEECEHEWEPVTEDQEPPEECPICQSSDVLVEGAED